jgi:hypothetical protein
MRVSTAALMAMLSLATTTVAAQSAGQTPPGPPPAGAGAASQAVRHYEDGVRAAKLALWAKAHESFLKAWKLEQHYQIAANLGRAELKLKKYRDAAEHLAYFMREAANVSADERKVAQAMLDEARTNVGSLTITVDRAGAEVLVDGITIGKAPISHEVFVEPGARSVAARLDGFDDALASLNVAAGVSRRVQLTPTARSGPEGSLTGKKSVPPPAPDQNHPSDTKSGARARTVIIATGITGAAIATGLGVTSVVVASAKDSDAQSILDHCHNGVCESHQAPAEYNDLSREQAAFQNVAAWSFIGAGALGASTLIYAFTASSSESTPRLTASVLETPGGGGVLVTVRW